MSERTLECSATVEHFAHSALALHTMLDTDQLRSFLAIVDTGGFTAAAARVNKTQSAVSMHVRRLEQRLGGPLFLKEGRGVRLSELGHRLVDHARRIVAAEATALAELATTSLAGRLVFGIPDDYATVFLSDIIARFTDRHPRVDLVVQCEDSQTLAKGVRNGEVDIALVTEAVGVTDVDVLREEQLCWVTGLNSGPVEFERPLPIALPAPGIPGHAETMDALHRADIPTRLFLWSRSHAAIAPVLRSGQAVTVLPIGLVDQTTLRICPSRCGLPHLPSVRYGMISRGEPSRNLSAMRQVLKDRLNQTP